MASRRALRTLTLAFSASCFDCLTSALRLSSVNGGIDSLMISPLFSGVMPNSESKMAFSITLNMDFSQGVITMVRASGTEILATLESGAKLP